MKQDKSKDEQVWYPRWYYILRNKTSGKFYFGQTKRDLDQYRGSGPYWVNHCKKHGGYSIENVEVLWRQWCSTKDEALIVIREFEEKEGINYWLKENTKWGNESPESIESYTFADVKFIDERIKRRKETVDTVEWKETTGAHIAQVASITHKGKIVSSETICKQLDTKRRNGNWYPSEESRKKAADKNRGSKRTPETRKRMSDAQKGSRGSGSKHFQIFDKNGNLMFDCKGNFKQTCEQNNLPYSSFVNAAQTGIPLYQNLKQSLYNMLVNNGNIKYQGWYVTQIEKEKL